MGNAWLAIQGIGWLAVGIVARLRFRKAFGDRAVPMKDDQSRRDSSIIGGKFLSPAFIALGLAFISTAVARAAL